MSNSDLILGFFLLAAGAVVASPGRAEVKNVLQKVEVMNSKNEQDFYTHAIENLAAAPLGIRRHNPGNIRWFNKTAWEGLDSGRSTDGDYCYFTDPRYGIRAMVRILRSYRRQGIDTLAAIINRWAPPEDNNITSAYVDDVSRRSGFGVTDVVSEDDNRFPGFIASIIQHENGMQPYVQSVIYEGIAWA